MDITAKDVIFKRTMALFFLWQEPSITVMDGHIHPGNVLQDTFSSSKQSTKTQTCGLACKAPHQDLQLYASQTSCVPVAYNYFTIDDGTDDIKLCVCGCSDGLQYFPAII